MKSRSVSFSLIILILVLKTTYGQSRWVNIYHDEWSAPVLFLTSSYDNGYLVSGRQEPNFAKYNWLIKTDINGGILWEKMIGNGINSIYLLGMQMNNNGSLFLCGGTKTEDPQGDPIIIKINPCGEKEWCKIYYTEDNLDYARCVATTPDGGTAITLSYTGFEIGQDRICLAKFSSEGIMDWKQCYDSPDTLIGNEDHTSLLRTTDNGFIISGRCYYPDPQGIYAWPEPYYIKTDSLGNFEWEIVAFSEIGQRGGEAWHTIMNPDSNFYYSSISYYNYDDGGSAPAILKIDLSGNIVDVYQLAPFGIVGKAFNTAFINDSTLAVSASWGDPDINMPMAVLCDTLGNIIQTQELLDNSYLSYVRNTRDEKLLFYTMMRDPVDDMFDAYLFKLNQDLSHAPVNTQTFTYDSLCPHQIISDTISQDDCGLIVGLEEIEAETESEKVENGIVVYPNPAISEISFQLSAAKSASGGLTVGSRQWGDGCVVEVWDLFGRKVEAMEVPPGQTELKSDVSGWPPGIYIAILQNDREILARRKFVVAR